MHDTAAALSWLVDLLSSRGIPFQVVGGLAAQAYGATRSLNDLDFYIPMQRFEDMAPEFRPYLTRPPLPYKDDAWDLTFAQLIYTGQKIELGGVEGAMYFDQASGAWLPQHIDFSRPLGGTPWRPSTGDAQGRSDRVQAAAQSRRRSFGRRAALRPFRALTSR